MAEPNKTEHMFVKDDHDTFSDLFIEYSDKVYRFFLVKTYGNRTLSEDLVQETFMKAWKARGSYDSTRPFRNWIFSIAHNAFVDSIRKMKLVEPIEDYELSDPKMNLEADMSIKLQVSKVLEHLDAFPKDQRDVIMLSYFGGLSSEEISKVIEKTPSGVRMIRMRTISKLQELFKNGGEVEW